MDDKKLLKALLMCGDDRTLCSKCSALPDCREDDRFIVKKAADTLGRLLTENAALRYDMHQLQGAICAYCANLYRPDGADHTECREFGDLSRFGEGDKRSPLICGKFAWRGVCPENTKEG